MAPGGQRRASIVRSGSTRTPDVGVPVVASGLSRTPRLRVLVADERGRSVSAPGLGRWLARVAPRRARGIVSVALVSDARVRALNRQYRRIDRPTDVLSFAAESFSLGSRGPTPIPNPFLGDIVIARGVARRQARDAGHSELTELRVLALHGLLHLLGYDHDRDNGRMRRVEQQLRKKSGLPEGLIERTRDAAAFASAKARAKRAAALSQERRRWGPGAVKKVGPHARK